jgi:hypothetical protein
VAQEWVRLNRDTSISLVLSRWAQRHPVLIGMGRPADIVDAIDAATPAGKDDLLRALVELFQTGEQLAGRITLQAMLPKLSHYAFRTGIIAGIEARPDDRFQVVICEFWEVLSRFPLGRRPARVAANLAMETLHRLTRMSQPAELPVDPSTMSVMAEPDLARWGRSGYPTGGTSETPDPDGDLEALLGWAVRRGAISADDARLLATVYADRSGDGRGEIAPGVSAGYRVRSATTGQSQAALRQRARRAKQRLTAAVAEAVVSC